MPPGAVLLSLAEGEGFEPSTGFPVPAFQASALGQLCDPSPVFGGGPPAQSWRARWDSNPRWLITTPLFESGTFNHSDTCPPESIPGGQGLRKSAVGHRMTAASPPIRRPTTTSRQDGNG